MNKARSRHRKHGWLKHHALSFAAVAILVFWVALYVYADPKTHWVLSSAMRLQTGQV
jgi:hypothetical protein